jgi:hypothetical protein
VFQLLQDADFLSDFVLGDELSVHLLDGDLPVGAFVAAAVDLPVGALPDAVALRENVVPHLDFDFVLHEL